MLKTGIKLLIIQNTICYLVTNNSDLRDKFDVVSVQFNITIF